MAAHRHGDLWKYIAVRKMAAALYTREDNDVDIEGLLPVR